MTETMTHTSEEAAVGAALSIDEQDLLFNAYFEGDLTEDEREAFDLRLEQDEVFRDSYNEFVEIMGGLRDLPFEFAPDDFVDKVQSRIRHRSRGRFFAENFLTSYRFPYEVIAAVMMIVMATAYMMMEAPHDAELRGADLTIDAPSELDKPGVDGTSGRSE